MKIMTWVKYEKSYIPPKCRKPRYEECEEYININLKERSIDEFKLAFEDNSYEGKGKIYFYKGNLYSKVKMPNISIVESLKERGVIIDSPLDYLKYCNKNCSSYFLSGFDREYYGMDTSREAALRKAKKEMNNYILIDNVLYEKTAEPRYVVNTFGLGHNHGGTGMFCAYYYNPNISNKNYFSALEGLKAVAYANMVASKRGDTKDVGKFKPFIVCHMPELVKVKPNKQHGNGNQLLNDCEEIINNTDNMFEAGLLIMAMCS